MNTRHLMQASAWSLGAAGVGASFLPVEILAALGTPGGGLPPTFVQLLGALWLAFAMLNWMARGSPMGGIYGRPIVVANLTHFAIGAMTLAKLVFAGTVDVVVITAATVYAAFAIAFGTVLFISPRRSP